MNRIKRFIIHLIIKVDSVFTKRLNLSEVEPSIKTLQSFKVLKKIVTECQKRNITLWVIGSWSLVLHTRKYIKQIGDIDLVTSDRCIRPLEDILIEQQFTKGNSKWPNMILYNKGTIDIEFYSIEDKHHILNKTRDFSEQIIKYDGIDFPVISRKALLAQYENLLFRRGRNIRNDLLKLKALSSAFV